jgi:hypothetical protein
MGIDEPLEHGIYEALLDEYLRETLARHPGNYGDRGNYGAQGNYRGQYIYLKSTIYSKQNIPVS